MHIEAPCEGSKWSGGQGEHAACPVSEANLPVVQLEHVAPTDVLWPNEPYFPTTHAVPEHCALPVSAVYIPAVHPEHAVCPVSGANFPAMQPMHADLPTPTWNMPVVQLEQVASPFVLWPSEPYFPAIQAAPEHVT